jgi:cell wall-associated NlpC family hydrolase
MALLIRLLPLLFLLLCASGCSLRSLSDIPPGGGKVAGSTISKTALSAVGTRYTYGGTNPSKGFDCSGLVCWSYSRNGINLPRTTREQSKVGSAISRDSLRPGDLVVFRISSGLHTGIYTGKGKFVHSPGKGKKVREDVLNAAYWKDKFIAGRRHRQIY